jgi:hypothetical protein
MNEAQLATVFKHSMFYKYNLTAKVYTYDEALLNIPYILKTKHHYTWNLIVINTTKRSDTSTLGGHWLGVLLNSKSGEKVFFDSLGFEPIILKSKYFSLLEVFDKNLNIEKTFTLTPYRIQEYNTNTCGDHIIYYTYYRICKGFSHKDVFERVYQNTNLLLNDTAARNFVCTVFDLCGSLNYNYNIKYASIFKKNNSNHHVLI